MRGGERGRGGRGVEGRGEGGIQGGGSTNTGTGIDGKFYPANFSI